MRFVAVLLLGLSLLYSSQGNTVDWIESEALEEFRAMKNAVLDFARDVRDTVRELRSGLHTELNRGLTHIDDTVEAAKVVARALPEHCTVGVQEHLEALKKASFWEFLKCSNMTSMLKESGEIVFNFVATAGHLMVSVNKMMTAPTDCLSWNIWAMGKCYVNLISTFKGEIQGDMNDVRELMNTTKILAQEVKENFHDCLYPKGNTSNIQKLVAQVMYKVNDCVYSEKPLKLY